MLQMVQVRGGSAVCLGFIGFIGFMGFIGFIGFIGIIGFRDVAAWLLSGS